MVGTAAAGAEVVEGPAVAASTATMSSETVVAEDVSTVFVLMNDRSQTETGGASEGVKDNIVPTTMGGEPTGDSSGKHMVLTKMPCGNGMSSRALRLRMEVCLAAVHALDLPTQRKSQQVNLPESPEMRPHFTAAVLNKDTCGCLLLRTASQPRHHGHGQTLLSGV